MRNQNTQYVYNKSISTTTVYRGADYLEVCMKQYRKAVAYTALILTTLALLASCSSLKPFTQDELDRLAVHNQSISIGVVK
jgi:hypothetical protein